MLQIVSQFYRQRRFGRQNDRRVDGDGRRQRQDLWKQHCLFAQRVFHAGAYVPRGLYIHLSLSVCLSVCLYRHVYDQSILCMLTGSRRLPDGGGGLVQIGGDGSSTN